MEFKEGSGWVCCYDPERNLYTARTGGGVNQTLFEIKKETYDKIDDPKYEWPASIIHDEGRMLFMSVNDRCGPPYTIIFDDDYKELCPWADTYITGKVWDENFTDAVVEVLASQENNREQRRKKREEREKAQNSGKKKKKKTA